VARAPARSTAGMTWSARSWEISRACMCFLGTPRTCGRAPRSPANHSGTSYNASPSTALSSRVWLSPRSCTPSSRARPLRTSCTSLSGARRSTPMSCSTLPPASLLVRRRWGHLRRQKGQTRGRRARGG
jgi:hypothetical protein